MLLVYFFKAKISNTGTGLILPANNEMRKPVFRFETSGITGKFQKRGMNYKLFQIIEIMTTGSEHTLKPYMVCYISEMSWAGK